MEWHGEGCARQSTLRFYMSHFNIVKKLLVHITYASIILLQISHCDTCQKMNWKMTTTRPELHPIPVKSPWHHVGVDFIGPLPRNVYILTLSDYLTKWVEAVPAPNKCASPVADILFKVSNHTKILG